MRLLNYLVKLQRQILRSLSTIQTVILYLNIKYVGAAVYFAIEKFQESIQDCDRAIEVKKDFVKVSRLSLNQRLQAYFRKAQALRELLDNLKAMEVLKEALQIEPQNEDLAKLFEETKTEYEEDNSLPADHPEKQRFDRLLKWLSDGGSEFGKLKIRYYTADYRGVHAARDIKKGETVLFVPKAQIITLEMAMESPVGKKMYEKGLRNRLISPKHSFLSTFIMQERRKADTIWTEYIDILPKNYSNFPMFFTDDEKTLLKGSAFLD